MGVTSLMAEISSPATWSERMAASRPAPGPLTHTSTRLRPIWMASRALASAAICAANGVLLREPLNPALPALPQLITLPSVSVIVMIVLLKLACTWATPLVPTLRSRFFAFLTSATQNLLAGRSRAQRQSTLLAGLHLLAADRHLLRTLARARIRLGALPVHRQAAAMPQAPVSADVHEALDVHGVLAAERAFHLVLALDERAQLAGILVTERLDARVGVHAGLFEQALRRRRANAEDVRECDLDALFHREIDACDACHRGSPLSPDAACAAGCGCRSRESHPCDAPPCSARRSSSPTHG